MGSLVRFSVAMDSELLERFDALAKRRGTANNRSEFVRDLVRSALVDSEWEQASGDVVGTVTMVFDHHTTDLSERLDALQHAHHERIVSTLHVHLDAHNCLEVLVIRGKSRDVSSIAETLLGTKGVKHGKLVMTTTGAGL